MEKFHPSIKLRLENLGRGYETLHNKTLDFQKEVHFFFTDYKNLMRLCLEQNNHQLVLQGERKLSSESLSERFIKVNHLADIAKRYMPDLSRLTYMTKPYIDGILGFSNALLKKMQELADHIENGEQSEAIMTSLEKMFAPLYKDFDFCRKNLDTCLEHFKEMRQLYLEVE